MIEGTQPHGFITARSLELLEEQRRRIYRDTDRLFSWLLLFQWLVGIAAAIWISPRSWAGASNQTHPHVWAAIFLGAAIGVFPTAMGLMRPGERLTRYAIAIGQMLTSALLIHLTGGRIETHFHVFGSLAFLASYRDWRVFVPATIVVVLDHMIRGIFWPQSVFGVLTASPWRWIEHGGWVVFENIFLIKSCLQSNQEMWRLAERQAQLEATNARVEETVRERTAALSRAELQCRHLVDSAQAIVWRADADTLQFSFVSKVGETMLGYPVAQWLSDPSFLGDHILPDDRDITLMHLREAARYGRKCEFEYRMVAADGRPVWLRDIVQAFHNEAGATELIGVLIDIDSQKQVEETLKRATANAEAASRAKSEFLANMSHEIRTPINGVIGMTKLALATDLTPVQKEYLTLTKVSADSLLTLINDILDFSKIEAGKLELDRSGFSIREMVEDSVRMLALPAHEKNLELTCRIVPSTPDSLVGDAGRLRQIIVNLVGNAVKFTAEGSVAVTVEVEAQSATDVVLRFSVADSGIGIPSDKHSQIFAAFTQADGSTTRRHGGSGLGLTITARLVHLMDGRIWVESGAGKGSRFYFTARFGLAESSVDQHNGLTTGLTDIRALIVDDNAESRFILEESLTSWGMCPMSVECGAAALAASAEANGCGRPFQVLLVDAGMPEMDGFELVARLSRVQVMPAAIVMMFTSMEHAANVERCSELCIMAHVGKPISQGELRRTISRALAPPTHKELRHPMPSESGMRSGIGIRILLAEDNVVNQKVARRLLEARGYEVTVTASGLEALAAWGVESFDLVLLDVQMPEMDGLELAAEIRRREVGIRTPIIALTASVLMEDRVECFAAGMDDFISKPIDSKQLYEKLGHWAALAPGRQIVNA